MIKAKDLKRKKQNFTYETLLKKLEEFLENNSGRLLDGEEIFFFDADHHHILYDFQKDVINLLENSGYRVHYKIGLYIRI